MFTRESRTLFSSRSFSLHHIDTGDIFTMGLLCFIVGAFQKEHSKTWIQCWRKTALSGWRIRLSNLIPFSLSSSFGPVNQVHQFWILWWILHDHSYSDPYNFFTLICGTNLVRLSELKMGEISLAMIQILLVFQSEWRKSLKKTPPTTWGS